MTLYVLSVIFFATLFRSTFGFGEALIAVPLLLLRVPLQIATPLAVVVSVTIAGIVVIQDWRSIHLRSALWLVGSTLFGIPVGLLVLSSSHTELTKIILGLVIIAFSVFSLFAKPHARLHDDHRVWLFVCGFLAGVLGAAFGMNGPPLVIYGAMRRWSAQHFRATLQAYFLPASLIGLIGYWGTGIWSQPVTRFYLWCLPATIVAILMGRALNQKLRGDRYLRYVHIGLIALGSLLIFQTIRLWI